MTEPTEPQIPPGLFCVDQDNAPGGHIVYSLSEPVARSATPRVRNVGLFDTVRRAVYRMGRA